MKKTIGFMLTLIMVFALTACGTGDLKQRIDDLKIQNGRHTEKIADLENQTRQQARKIADIENELESMKTSDDFVLTVTVDSSFVSNGGEIVVHAALKNQSGKAHDITYPYDITYSYLMGCYIDGWRSIWYPDDPPWLEPSPPLPTRSHSFEADTSIYTSFHVIVSNQEPGAYVLCVTANFILDRDESGEEDWDEFEHTVFLESNKIAIIVQ